jgi:hypothetical protein
MKDRIVGGILATTLLTAALTTAGCGYFLYPERRGNTGGGVDGGTLVMDLLWLLPGLVPGVVALIVDFSSGAIYVGRGSRMAVRMSPGGHVAVRLPQSAKPARLDLRLVTADRQIVAQRTALVGPSVGPRSVELQVAWAIHDTLYLEIVSEDGASLRFPTSIQVAR